MHPTLGTLRVARFQAFFHASAFSQSDGVPPPAPARVPRRQHPGHTQTVGTPLAKVNHFENVKLGLAKSTA